MVLNQVNGFLFENGSFSGSAKDAMRFHNCRNVRLHDVQFHGKRTALAIANSEQLDALDCEFIAEQAAVFAYTHPGLGAGTTHHIRLLNNRISVFQDYSYYYNFPYEGLKFQLASGIVAVGVQHLEIGGNYYAESANQPIALMSLEGIQQQQQQQGVALPVNASAVSHPHTEWVTVYDNTFHGGTYTGGRDSTHNELPSGAFRENREFNTILWDGKTSGSTSNPLCISSSNTMRYDSDSLILFVDNQPSATLSDYQCNGALLPPVEVEIWVP